MLQDLLLLLAVVGIFVPANDLLPDYARLPAALVWIAFLHRSMADDHGPLRWT